MRDHPTITPEEVERFTAKAEELMTPEQRAATETREKFKFQEKDPFEDHLDDLERGDERRPANEEDRRAMDARMRELGRAFADSGVRWQLDGALNISLMRGEYIGVHKDVDVSVEADDLGDLDAALSRNGYGLFLSYDKEPGKPGSKKIWERVNADQFRNAKGSEHRLIVAVDKDGRARDDADLNAVDVHVVDRDADGAVAGTGIPLPEKWSQPREVAWKGSKIMVSHPAKTAFFKLHMGRSYDMGDLRLLAETGEVTEEDAEEIRQLIEEEYAQKRAVSERIIGSVLDRVHAGATEDEAYARLIEEPTIKSRMKPETVPFLKEIARAMAEEKRGGTPGRALEVVLSGSGHAKAAEDIRKKADAFAGAVRDARKAAETRKGIDDIGK